MVAFSTVGADAAGEGRGVCRPPAVSRTPTTTIAHPSHSTSEGRSPSRSHADVRPVTGTSIENGATVPAGCRAMSQDQMPVPMTVAMRLV
ncbi:hypothetical protein JNB_11629 [Janibacter sp. HTCC2649]|nr:hypothetical protein JNB_11629 [Janibacter sp. HTCC2649]